jgi:hypothetical protein
MRAIVRANAQRFIVNPMFDDKEHLEDIAGVILPHL